MPKSKKIKSSFSPQPYPLYVWGMWVDKTADFKVKGGSELIITYNIDRLTIAGWQDYGRSRIEPMVVHIGHGVIALKTITNDMSWERFPNLSADIRKELEEQIYDTQYMDEFLVVDIAISAPEKEVFDTAEKIHRMESQGYEFSARRALEQVQGVFDREVNV